MGELTQKNDGEWINLGAGSYAGSCIVDDAVRLLVKGVLTIIHVEQFEVRFPGVINQFYGEGEKEE